MTIFARTACKCKRFNPLEIAASSQFNRNNFTSFKIKIFATNVQIAFCVEINFFSPIMKQSCIFIFFKQQKCLRFMNWTIFFSVRKSLGALECIVRYYNTTYTTWSILKFVRFVCRTKQIRRALGEISK